MLCSLKYNVIKISPFISLSVCFCRSWKDLTQPLLRHVLVTSCHDLFNLKINQWKCMYLIVVDTTHSVTFASPLHRSMYKRSSDWSVDNRSLGHQNVSRTGLRWILSRATKTESDMKGLILIRLLKIQIKLQNLQIKRGKFTDKRV